jgi:esterase/lipase superfamily enzyme
MIRPTRSVLIWDTADTAAKLAANLVHDDVEHIIARPSTEIAAHVDHRTPNVLHLVAPDDGSDLPITAGENSETLPPLWTKQPPEVIILDGCYHPNLAEQLRASGTAVIGVPGRLGRGNADDFLRIWYTQSTSVPIEDAFDEAMTGALLHTVPDSVQPRLHNTERKSAATFRRQDGTAPRTVTVWYGTNRHPVPSAQQLYSEEPDDELHTGRCEVVVPAGVPVGQTRSRRVRGGPGPSSYTVRDHLTLTGDSFHTDLRAALRQHDIGSRSVLVYIHGYRTTFIEAATRAAQLHVDLNHPGHTAFFSWPSRGTTAGYFADEDSVQHAERHLLRFLTELHQQAEAEQINVLAHSMGNRALLRVAMRLAHTERTDLPRLGHVFLAAADVGRHFYQAEATAYGTIADTVTSYVSSRDKALKSSGIVHRGDRAGLTPPHTHVAGIDTIDATDIDLTYLCHGYYAAARPVLTDMHLILRGNDQPQNRIGLESRTEPSGQVVWQIRP